MVEKRWTPLAVMGVTLMLTFGTGTMVSAKIMLQTTAPTRFEPHTEKNFDKPIYQSFLMFFAMSMCLPIYFIYEGIKHLITKRRRGFERIPSESPPNNQQLIVNGHNDDYVSPEELLKRKKKKRNATIKNYVLIIIPSLCDLLATTLMTTGLIFIEVSVMQMLRGSMVIFSAIMTIFIRKRLLKGYEWLGVALCCTALVLVGLAQVVGGSKTSQTHKWSAQLLGCLLVITSQVIQATQIIVEEFLLADLKAPPLVVVGMEGMWGMFLCIFSFIPMFYFLPGKDNGHYEDTYDSFYMLFHSKTLLIASAIYWISILLLNYGGMVVTQQLTAVHRTIFEALRTLAIWITNIFIFYVFRGSPYGEGLTLWSILQAAGFAVLITSTAIYNKAIKLVKCFIYPAREEAQEQKVDRDPEDGSSDDATDTSRLAEDRMKREGQKERRQDEISDSESPSAFVEEGNIRQLQIPLKKTRKQSGNNQNNTPDFPAQYYHAAIDEDDK
ncbi:MAG: Solute carrier family 35 member [Streblomastix strix]|uniref:Solute carrier family 35 member n=1 Tax=Streblomastix strix TaxID=222440 RepID=A0A5J4W6V5_9EUKA|nr:MAG: Solute carrier family 35 member [Streblomastix strix]